MGRRVQRGKRLTLSPHAREALLHHPCPGNIRELQNAIERSLITSEGTLITAAHLAIPLGWQPVAAGAPPPAAAPSPASASPAATAGEPGSLQDLERAAILEALQRAHGHKSHAAARLGLTRFQLYTRLKRRHIDVIDDKATSGSVRSRIPNPDLCVSACLRETVLFRHRAVPHADVQNRTLRVRQSSSRSDDPDFSAGYGLGPLA